MDLSGELMAKYTLPSIALMGLCTAFLQGGVLQLASIFSAVHIRVSLGRVGGYPFTKQSRIRYSSHAGM